MSNLCKRAGAPRRLVLALTAVLALAVAGGASAEFPTKRSDPSVSGTPQEGQTLNGHNGQWLDANGLPCTDCKFTYTWQRCNPDTSGCADVAGATSFTYLLGAADVGRRIRLVEWIFKRDCGAINNSTGTQECQDITKNGTSALTPIVAARPITTAQNTAVPTIQGTAMEDEVLRATTGTWTAPGAITKQFFWQRCNLSGEGCVTIVGATGETYILTVADVGSRVRVIETATNGGGTAQAVSATTSVVVELQPTAARPTIAVAKVKFPHRLVLDEIVTRQKGDVVTVLVKVSDDRGFRVSGVDVRVTPTGLLVGPKAARRSTATGWATFTFRATGSGSTYLYVDARRRGERPQSGISTANLFTIRVRR